jgi:hypothetical protein
MPLSSKMAEELLSVFPINFFEKNVHTDHDPRWGGPATTAGSLA